MGVSRTLEMKNRLGDDEVRKSGLFGAQLGKSQAIGKFQLEAVAARRDVEFEIFLFFGVLDEELEDISQFPEGLVVGGGAGETTIIGQAGENENGAFAPADPHLGATEIFLKAVKPCLAHGEQCGMFKGTGYGSPTGSFEGWERWQADHPACFSR